MADLDAEQAALQEAMFGGDMSTFSDDTQGTVATEEAETFEDEQEEVAESDFEPLQEEGETTEEFDARKEIEQLRAELSDKNAPTQYSQEDQNLINTGRQIQQLQNQNPQLYNEMIQFAQQRMSGTASPTKREENAIEKQIKSFRDTIESDSYKDMDTKPFKQMADLMELQLQQNKELYNNNQQARQQITNKVNELDSYRASSEQAREQKRADAQLRDLASAEKEFGIKIKQGSKAAKRLVALVDSGENVRDAFVLVTGKTEKAKATKKKGITTSSGESKATQESPDKQALRKHIFGDTTKKRGVIKYYD